MSGLSPYQMIRSGIDDECEMLHCEEQFYLDNDKSDYQYDPELDICNSSSHFTELSNYDCNFSLDTSSTAAVFFSQEDVNADHLAGKPPCFWNDIDVAVWIQYMIAPYATSVGLFNTEAFSKLDGHDLVQMSRQQFQQRDAQLGSMLYDALQKWCGYGNEPYPSADNKASDCVDMQLDPGLAIYPINPNDTFESFASLNEVSAAYLPAQFTCPPEPVISQPLSPAPSSQSEGYGSDSRVLDYPSSCTPEPDSDSGCESDKPSSKSKGHHLWEFVRDLLLDSKYNPEIIKWEDREQGIFKFVKSDQVAKLWGKRKNNPGMTYEKMSRAMRFCRKRGNFAGLPSAGRYPKKLCFQFGPKSDGWRTDSAYYYKRNILERIDGRRLVYKFGPVSSGWQL